MLTHSTSATWKCSKRQWTEHSRLQNIHASKLKQWHSDNGISVLLKSVQKNLFLFARCSRCLYAVKSMFFHFFHSLHNRCISKVCVLVRESKKIGLCIDTGYSDFYVLLQHYSHSRRFYFAWFCKFRIKFFL